MAILNPSLIPVRKPGSESGPVLPGLCMVDTKYIPPDYNSPRIGNSKGSVKEFSVQRRPTGYDNLLFLQLIPSIFPEIS